VSDPPRREARETSLVTTFTSMLLPQQRAIDRLIKPLQTFAKNQLAGAGLLMVATVLALGWANSPWEHGYHELLELDISLSIGETRLGKSLHHWINDGLMGVFFFLVGLEIKREIMVGELSSMRKAALPAVAALGGMVVPAAIYFSLNASGAGARGWGIPMATDIAFALGVLALLGNRVPLGLKVFLTALAIADDIGAVLVIAVFYTSDLSVLSLFAGVCFLTISVGMSLLGTRNPVAYLFVGLCAWLAFLESGVHATIAALLMAFTIPARTRIDGEDFFARMEILLQRLKAVGIPSDTTMNTGPQQHTFEQMNQQIDHASAPLQRIEHSLAAPVTFVVLPVFALANAGVTLHGDVTSVFASPIVLGIVAGLFIGKTLGIAVAAWLAVKLRIADLPRGVTWLQVVGVATLGGIGFTMALFVASLAFDDRNLVETAKVGILTGSLVAGVVGFLLVRYASPDVPVGPAEKPKPPKPKPRKSKPKPSGEAE
jgi:NhaA family Na+:H+ antiporter